MGLKSIFRNEEQKRVRTFCLARERPKRRIPRRREIVLVIEDGGNWTEHGASIPCLVQPNTTRTRKGDNRVLHQSHERLLRPCMREEEQPRRRRQGLANATPSGDRAPQRDDMS